MEFRFEDKMFNHKVFFFFFFSRWRRSGENQLFPLDNADWNEWRCVALGNKGSAVAEISVSNPPEVPYVVLPNKQLANIYR